MKKSRQHHWLVFGVVHFSIERPVQDSEDVIQRVFGEVPLNGIITAPHQYINAHRMGKAQEALMLRAAQKVANDTFKVEDVILENFTYLGHMTDEEFKAEEIVSAPADVIESASPLV